MQDSPRPSLAIRTRHSATVESDIAGLYAKQPPRPRIKQLVKNYCGDRGRTLEIGELAEAVEAFVNDTFFGKKKMKKTRRLQGITPLQAVMEAMVPQAEWPRLHALLAEHNRMTRAARAAYRPNPDGS